MIFANSRAEAPNISSDFASRSKETVGSSASIFAMRDWLAYIALANPICVSRCRILRAFSPCANLRRKSM
jgi:hypothetical protein